MCGRAKRQNKNETKTQEGGAAGLSAALIARWPGGGEPGMTPGR